VIEEFWICVCGAAFGFWIGEKDMKQKRWNTAPRFLFDNLKSKSGPADQNPKWVRLATLVLAFALCGAVAEAQQAGKIWRIGFLLIESASDPLIALRLDALRQGLRDLGYVEGKNINIEYRYAEGKAERLPELAEELVRLKVDILVSGLASAARAAKKSTKTIPIVVANIADLSGLVDSLARPGGNVTGLTSISAELLGKRLGLLKEVVPKVSRFAFLHAESGAASASAVAFKDAQGTAKFLGIKFQLVEVKALNPDIEGAFRLMVKERIGALVTSPAPPIAFHRKRILQLTEQNRIPAIHPDQQWTNDGGLMSYGANSLDQWRRLAVYVDKLLKGRTPADLPVEQPMKFEFVINLQAAKKIGITVPQSVLYRADKVIK
jgi:putative ABC transport system substrate-binding protein